MIENYQSRILKPDEIVDYSNELIRTVRPETIQFEPCIGFKIMCKDLNAYTTTQANRFQFLEQNLGFLRNSGCIIRETHPSEAPDGFWVISFPVPQSQLSRQLINITNVIDLMAHHFGIVSQDMIEINVSGRCPATETEYRLSAINIPQNYRRFMVEPTNTPYKMGHILRINEDFALLRTMWDWRNQGGSTTGHMSDLLVIPQLLTAMFH